MKAQWKSVERFIPIEYSKVIVVYNSGKDEYDYCICVYTNGEYLSAETGYKKAAIKWDYVEHNSTLLDLIKSLKLPTLNPPGVFA